MTETPHVLRFRMALRARSSVELQFPAYVRQRTTTSTDDLSAFASYDLLVGCSERAQAFRAAELWGWRLGSAEPVLLSAGPPDEVLLPVSWSPDGSRLAYPVFTSQSPGSVDVETRIVSVDTDDEIALDGKFIAWSPDRRYLALTRFGDSVTGLEIRDVTSGEQRKIDVPGACWSPRWNPVGASSLCAALSSSSSPALLAQARQRWGEGFPRS